MRYAIGRQKHLKELRSFSIIDELTGLYNRWGFLTLAEQQLKMVDRVGKPLVLVFADLDGLKSINDAFGHHRGDLALMETAHVLREAFRETDVLSRLGGDEFVALLLSNERMGVESVLKHFQETLDEQNRYRNRPFKLSVSIGVAIYDPTAPCSIEALLKKPTGSCMSRKNQERLNN